MIKNIFIATLATIFVVNAADEVDSFMKAKANIQIALDVIADREQRSIDIGICPTADIVQAYLNEFNLPNDANTQSTNGILFGFIETDPLHDMVNNPESVVHTSALSHSINFPYDPTAVPQYDRVGDGNVVFGTFCLENLMSAVRVAHSIKSRLSQGLKVGISDGSFKTFEDVLTTYNALKAYLNYMNNLELVQN